jgi:DNA polymerase-3 subunit delta'
MLEEPPPNVFLLLLAESADAMLVTVRSRVRLYRMQRFRPHEIDRYLMQESPEAVRKKAERPAEYEAILQGADGCIGAALALLDPTKAEHLLVTKRTVESLLDALRGTSFVPIYQATAALPTSRAELSLVLESFAMALRDLALIKKIKEPHLCFFSKKEEAEAAAGGLTLSKILHVSEGIEQCLEGLERNANVSLLLTDLRDLFKSS